MSRRIIACIAFVALMVSLGACGGGGGGGGAAPPPPPPGSSNWDQLVWDQDNWS